MIASFDLRPFNDWWLSGGWVVGLAIILGVGLAHLALGALRERRRKS